MRSKRFLPIVALLGLVAQSGCGDLLTESPRSIVTADNFYQTGEDARAAVLATYTPLAGNLLYGLNASSDDSFTSPLEENPILTGMGTLHYDARNTQFSTYWNAMYDVITRSNAVIERVPGIPMSESSRANIVGEAKFLRSFAYFYLVRLFGDVPLVRTAEEQLTNNSRTAKAEVYAQIVKDAEEAEAALPASWPSTERGRATKGAAQAHLASVHVWLSSRENANQWDRAAAAAKRVIDSNLYRLESNWLNAFLPGSQNSPESIFLALACGATGCPTITTSQWMYPREMESSGTGGFATQMPLPEFIATFPAGDYRAVTGSQVGLPGTNGVGYFTSGRRLNGQIVTFAPHIYKFRQSTKPGPADVNNPFIRYADVLLLYAEAVNELGRPAEAIGYVNMIRTRARGGATGSENRAQPANLPEMSQALTREAIFQERRWELAHEGKRWFDLVRRGEGYFLTSMAKDKYATGADAKDMLWPIPQAQIDINPILAQNPGY